MSALLLLALLGAEPLPYEAVVPDGATAAMLVTVQAGDAFAFDVSPDGQPVIARGDTFAPLKDRPERAVAAFRVAGVDAGAMAFTADGALLVVSGRALGVVTANGFRRLVALPADGMRLVAAGPGEVLAFAGEHLYRVTAKGRVEHLLQAPAPIDAVAADATRIVVAVGRAVIELGARGPELLVQVPSRLTGLAFGPGGGLFAASASGVEWLANGKRAPVISGKGGALRVRGDALYVLFEDEGLLKVAPLDGFVGYGERLDAALAGGRP